MDKLIISGARQHNLKNISLTLPKNKFIVFTGVSGSGKSSLAFDTIYAEGQRRYVESLSSYARQFLGIMDKPDVDSIIGLSPAISIDQKSTSHNPRSTVGTVTEIYDYLRLLFARIGHPHCPDCSREIAKLAPSQIVTMTITHLETILRESKKPMVFTYILSPVVRDRKGEFSGLFDNLRAKGFRQVRVDGTFYDIDEYLILIKTNKHTIDVVVDKLSIERKILKNEVANAEVRSRLTDAIEQSLTLSNGYVTVGTATDASFTIPDKPKHTTDSLYSEHFSCPVCNISMPELEPRLFSFNSPHGACPTCTGLGVITTVDPVLMLNPGLSIAEGGISPFAKMFYHDTWYSRIIDVVAKQNHIDVHVPIKQLTPDKKQILLYGTDDTTYTVTGTNRFGENTTIYESFHGVIPELTRRYRETTSEYVRGEIEKYMQENICTVCQGTRLKKEGLNVTIVNKSIAGLVKFSIDQAKQWVIELIAEKQNLLSTTEQTIAIPILKEINTRLQFLIDVGLEYLTIDRPAASLSGGEAQRIRLASQIGSGLSGVLYILDEPSIGLHQRDNEKLITTLKHLRDLGNTVIVVEHDRDIMRASDYLVDFGPGAGEHGGSIVAYGEVEEILKNAKSLTAVYLSEQKTIIRTPKQLDKPSKLCVAQASHHNLKNITVEFPLGLFICITGVSGSGKSSLVVDTLYPALAAHFNPMSKLKPGAFNRMTGMEYLDKTILIDQSPIGRTPRSNPATYTGIFTIIREIFSQLPEARLRGYGSGRFSFNVKGGRCEVCEGEGQKKIEMQFLSDVFVTCEICHGTRYNPETLEVLYHGKSIFDILNMSIDEAMDFFTHFPYVHQKLQTIHDVGLGYIHLGQPATTLSGGEAQRVKLSAELMKRATGKTLYILDEPTTGLHFEDLRHLLSVLDRLVSVGNTVIVIEHNLDIIKNADWIIDMGPAGGEAGGYIIATGTPGTIMTAPHSYTGQWLKKVL